MKQYKLLNNICGWIAFAVAAYTYLMTVESAASFWDCPEFITCAAKGEVGHPPGNTFFNLTGRFFVNFAGGDMSQAAIWVNRMSALFSAGTILFLFWTITALTKKLVCMNNKKNEMTWAQAITILGAGMVGALVYTWSDTFWFSAVEAEVYAFSSFMTALVFWLILKWENNAAGVEGDRYIILLAYIIGLSIGVHLLNLLCIPAIVLVYYFKKVPNANLKGTLGALILSMFLIAFILYGMIPGLIRLASVVELFFVNGLGFGYNSGTMFYFFFVVAILLFALWKVYNKETSDKAMRILLIAGVVFSGMPFVSDNWFLCFVVAIVLSAIIYFFKKLNARLASNILFCLLSIIIGYSTFAQIIIRSSAQLPMDQNSPDEIFSFTKYLNREQYGESPLFFGQTFASEIVRDKSGAAEITEGAPLYTKVVKKDPSEPDRYEITGHKETYHYNYNTLFPRMYSRQANHIEGYKEWSDFKGEKVRVDGKTITVPTFGENLTYFLRYQLNFMYWRYFMWNFSGRQSDVQCYGEIDRGNWITGISFIDEFLVGDQNMPSAIKDNKGHNVFYMLPLLLGIIGLLWQAYAGNKGIQEFWVVFFLFFMTGIAIVIYLNQTPYQPRERDYAYAGSFYAFAIWVGMGVAGIMSLLNKYLKKDNAVLAAVISIICLGVPFQMVGQTWDDHDRSGRYAARDFGRNYLSSLEENAIIFTNGDNDTFPLWYAQDVENYRTDVRVCNLSYLQTDWYINQMKAQAYESEPLPIALRKDQYNADNLNYAHIIPMVEGEKPLGAVLNYLYSDDAKYKTLPNYEGRIDYIPTGKLYLDVDSAAVANSPVISVSDPSQISKRMHIDISSKSILVKNEIAMLSMIDEINKEGWKRPVYIAATVGSEMYLSLNRYFRLCGLAYQIVPLEGGGTSTCDIDKTYDNLMNKFVWGNVQDTTLYLDENIRRMCKTQRMMFCTLIDQLLEINDLERALKATEYCDATIPYQTVPYDYTALTLAQTYLACGKPEEGKRVMRNVIESDVDYLDWAYRLNINGLTSISRTVREHVLTMREVLKIAEIYELTDIEDEYTDLFNQYVDLAYQYKVLSSSR
ncbi:MAG: DUF2723 domain-containing protein [Bacteroidales bacterium]|nr:DUF2723 domain-containing protein [Bacteroidales bacterium]